MSDQIGERIAGLEAAFQSFRNETLKDMKYIRDKLDAIAESVNDKVDRPYCRDRHEKLDNKVDELARNGKRDELLKRVRALEQKVPAIVQQAVLTVATAVLTAIAIRAIP